jgi:hypothetical protein
VSLLGYGSPTLASTGGFSYNVGTHVATWTYNAPFAADQYLIQLTDAVTDVAGNHLDGEWTNPFSVTTTSAAVSKFPSGNGTAGGAFRFVFTILPGDANLSNLVDGGDYLTWLYSQGGPGRTFTQADYNGDGMTDGADYSIWSANFGSYDLRALIFADFDGNGIVNGSDYYTWSQHYGETGAPHSHGDADNDGAIGGVDMFIWVRQQGLLLSWVA